MLESVWTMKWAPQELLLNFDPGVADCAAGANAEVWEANFGKYLMGGFTISWNILQETMDFTCFSHQIWVFPSKFSNTWNSVATVLWGGFCGSESGSSCLRLSGCILDWRHWRQLGDLTLGLLVRNMCYDVLDASWGFWKGSNSWGQTVM